MNIEAVLGYVTLHSQSIIQWLFLSILLMVGTLVARALFGRGDESAPRAAAAASTHSPAPSHEPSLVSAPGSLPPPRHEDGGIHESERVKTLEAELQRQRDEMSKLKVAAEHKPSDSAAPTGERIKELEARLAEYEILEDDIADLTLYKEENQRLKSELESLKSGAPVANTASAAADDGSEAVENKTASAPAFETAPARTAEAAAEAAAAAAAFDEQSVSPAEAPAPAAANDLFAEFATALEESGTNPSENPKAG